MRSERQEQELKFTRRALMMAGGGGLAFLGLGARLYSLQIMQSETYRGLSEDNQFRFDLVPPSRGRILDRFGVPIADNRASYRALIVPERTGGVEEAIDRLSAHVPISEADRERLMRAIARAPGYRSIIVADDLDWESFARINLHAPDLRGITPDVGEVRAYPHAEAFSHVIGYVQSPNDRDLEEAGRENERLLRHPGFRIGKTGVEIARETDLRGTAGALKVEVNAFGRVIRELPQDSLEPAQGRDVVMTLDTDIQTFAHDRLDGQSASAVAIDVRTGELIALTSTPGFDPNLFVTGISQTDFSAYQQNPYRPLFNKSLQGTYPPGSTFKAVTAAAILENDVFTPDHSVVCNGVHRVGNRDFHCWRPRGHGRVDLREAVKTSCDVYFYQAAEAMGIDRLYEMGRRFGLGEEFDLGVPGVASGIMPNAQWKRARRNEGWSTGDTVITAIGQGFTTASPLQLAVMTARVASGRAVTPTLYRNAMQPPAPHIGVSDEALERVRDGLMAVCHEPGGTSFSLGGLGVPGVLMAGKTGTAQVYSISAEEREAGVRDQEDLPWRLRDHGLFVCYAPADEPRYAVAVVVEHGGGSSAATRPARDILRRCIERDPSGRPGIFASLPASGERRGG